MPIFRSSARALAGFQGNHCASPKVFGAKGDGVTDDLVAIQKAIDHLKALKGGGVLVIDGIYRVTNQLLMDCKVSVEGTGSGKTAGSSSGIMIDHATAPVFRWATAASGFGYTRQRIKNLFIGATQASTGAVFSQANSCPIDLLVENLTVNESPAFGLLNLNVWQSADSSRISFKDCELNQTSGNPLVLLSGAGSEAIFDNCHFQTPTGASEAVLTNNAGRFRVSGCDFFGGASSVNGRRFIHTGAAGSTRAYGNTFRANDADIWPAFTWVAGARLVESDNTYDGTQTTFTAPTGTPDMLGAGSRLSLIADRRFTSSGSLTIPDYIENVTITDTSNATPTYTLPHRLFPGQHLRVNLQNTSGGSVTPIFVPQNPVGGTIAAVPNNGYATYDFVVADLVTAGTYTWYLMAAGHT